MPIDYLGCMVVVIYTAGAFGSPSSSGSMINYGKASSFVDSVVMFVVVFVVGVLVVVAKGRLVDEHIDYLMTQSYVSLGNFYYLYQGMTAVCYEQYGYVVLSYPIWKIFCYKTHIGKVFHQCVS